VAHNEESESVQLGFLGELHPLVARLWDLGRTAAFAIDLGKLAAVAPPVVDFRAYASVPPLRQDLAVTLADTVAAVEVLERVRAAGGEMLEDASIFDVYAGEQVGEGRRSLALALTFRAPDSTLTDEDVAPLRERIVAALRERGIRVIDLSADFRLASLDIYEQWYGEHPRPDLLGEAVYGLTELHRERITGAGIVANPGCYPTASLLGLAPLARAGLIADVVIDAKQGVSGAGRVFDDTTHFSMAGENI